MHRFIRYNLKKKYDVLDDYAINFFDYFGMQVELALFVDDDTRAKRRRLAENVPKTRLHTSRIGVVFLVENVQALRIYIR